MPSNTRITALIEICSKDKSAINVRSTNRLVKKHDITIGLGKKGEVTIGLEKNVT